MLTVVVLPINSFVEPLVSLSLDHSDKLVGLLSLSPSDKLVGLPSLSPSDRLVGLLPRVSLFKLSQSFIAV